MRLLVVEDDVALVTSLERGLRGASFAVDAAPSAEAAHGLLALNLYDLVLLDLGLRMRTVSTSSARCGGASCRCPCSS